MYSQDHAWQVDEDDPDWTVLDEIEEEEIERGYEEAWEAADN